MLNERIKIASISCAFPPYAGGMANSAKQISRLLADKFSVTDFHPDNLKPILRRGHGAFSPSLFFKLRKFDYIYLHYPFFGTAEVVWFFKLFFKKPKLIIHYHMDVKSLKLTEKILSLPSYLILNSLLNQAEIIVSASLDYISNSRIKNYYQNHVNKFSEIVFAVDLEKFRPKEINRPGGQGIIAKTKSFINFVNEKFIKKDRAEFIFVGGLDSAHYFKGLDNLIKALSLVPGNWHLNIVGDGNLKNHYEVEVYKNGLEKKIHFLGRLSDPDLIRAYQNSECLILPSINNNEAFGIVLIEAMACGLSVIASNLAGVRGVFSDQKQGLLVNVNDIGDLRDKLKLMVNDKNLRRTMSLRARELAERLYNENEMKKKLEKLFN